MKKILVWALTLISVTTVCAQNTSSIQQIGEGQTGLNVQSGFSLTGVISQTATSPTSNSGNEGYMYQTGTGHTAVITQTDGSTYNRAGVGQDGNGNLVLIQQIGSGGQGIRNLQPEYSSGEGNWAGIAQNGSGNHSIIWQNESNEIYIPDGRTGGVGERSISAPVGPKGVATQRNFAEIWQYGFNNGAGDTFVWIDQSGALNNRGEIFQGDDSRAGTTAGTYSTSIAVSDNTASIDQSNGSTENFGNIRQFSSENMARIFQNDATSSKNKADIRQGIGDSQANSGGNIGVVIQTTNSTSNTATMAQYGQEGAAYIFQYGLSGSSTSNVASVSQSAGSSFNSAFIDQGDFRDEGGNSTNNNGRIVQAGTRGYSRIVQAFESSMNTALINQGSGTTSSSALIGQRQSTGGTATIMQNLTATGSSNNAIIEQGTELVSSVSSMSATIRQEGGSNAASLLQLGSSHQVVINQYGNGNIVKGTGTTTIRDNGTLQVYSNMAEQTGTGHSLVVNQTSPGGANSTIFNTLDIQQSGTGSNLTITQIAETVGNVMVLRQSGNTNQAFIQQNGSSAINP